MSAETASLFTLYQQVTALSNECLSLAQQAEWEALIERERVYINAVEKLFQMNPLVQEQLSPPEREQLRERLQEILGNEAEIRRLLQNRMQDLRNLIGVSTQQRDVNATYHKFADRKSMLPGDAD